MKADREFDIVLWGATGFTGQLVARYLADHPDLEAGDWAIAGRNRDKLQALRADLGGGAQGLSILVGDALDRDSLDAIAARTRVVCTTVGPYAKFGSDLVAACVEAGTDYCDLTGEAYWIREMIEAHHRRAEERDVRIVHCCGFDSIPSDLGTYLVQREANDRFGTPCEEVRLLVWKIRGSFSGGTFDSMATMFDEASADPGVRRIIGHPYALNPDGERSGPDGSIQQGPRRDPLAEVWTAPFVMAGINEKIVRRTNALLDFEYGRDFRYSEAVRTGDGASGALKASAMSAGIGAFAAGMALEPTRKLLQRWVLPEPGEGPDQQSRNEGFFVIRLFGRGTDDEGVPFAISAEVGADKDPGYGATSIMLAESALCLAHDDTEGGLTAGVLTPASAMGSTLLERLEAAGIRFKVD